MSVIAPMRKPSSNPCFTQELTSHLPFALFSAARISPRFNARFSSSKTARSSLENLLSSRAAIVSIFSRNSMRDFLQETEFVQDLTQTPARLLLNGHERKTKVLFEQTHERHRRFHRTGTRLDEVGFQQRQ